MSDGSGSAVGMETAVGDEEGDAGAASDTGVVVGCTVQIIEKEVFRLDCYSDAIAISAPTRPT